jgi:hypothetical protein
MDIDAIHTALQFPMVMMFAALAVALAMRARSIIGGDVTMPSAAILLCLSGFMAASAVRSLWWHVRWALKSLDMHDASEIMVSNALVPLICNIVALGFGGAVLSIASYPALGRMAIPLTLAGIVVGAVIGGMISGVVGW